MRIATCLVGFAGLIVFTSGTIDLNNLFNYSNQTTPNYITKDNISGNPITDEGATLGRVLFYDKNLSANNTIACASCHKQEFAFSDTAVQSVGLTGGLTGRHSMRLVNTRYSDEVQFFWDERATSLEDQTTKPIQDHIEMGFSGADGDPDIDSLITKLEGISYYITLFDFAFGDSDITEDRMQLALAQFIRSIQSFDAKYDEGRALVPNDGADFPNYTASENAGKSLYLAPPGAGGAGCGGCHRPPEFDIDPNAGNNGIIGQAGSQGGTDYTNTRAPSLRDIVNPSGALNGPLMHTGEIATLAQLVEHYNAVPNDPNNNNLDNRLAGPGANLNLTDQEKSDLIAFLGTLTGSDIYTNEKWSDPFDENGGLDIIYLTGIAENQIASYSLYPNPTRDYIRLSGIDQQTQINVYDLTGSLVLQQVVNDGQQIDVSILRSGSYLMHVESGSTAQVLRFVKSR